MRAGRSVMLVCGEPSLHPIARFEEPVNDPTDDQIINVLKPVVDP
jgi:hypothetical protein